MLKNVFWNGLKAFIPVVVTLAIVIWVFRNIETFFGRAIQYVLPEQYYFDGLGIILGIVLVLVIGVLVNAWIIKQIYNLAEKLVKKIPVIKTIYNAIQDLMIFFDKTRQPNNQQAVIVETQYGKVIGFVTREDLSTLPEVIGGEKEVLVYVPLSYQIGGLMISIPKKQITPLEWGVNKTMSFVLTAGMTGDKKDD